MTPQEVTKKIQDAGYKFDRVAMGKIVFKRGEDYILFCSGCGWIKTGKNEKYGRAMQFRQLTDISLT